MIVRKGYDAACAEAMRQAEGLPPDGFHERCKMADFWGLFDPEACGAIVVEHGIIHVSSFKPCGFAVRRVLREYKDLYTVIRPENARAERLALGMGFSFVRELDGFRLYRRKT